MGGRNPGERAQALYEFLDASMAVWREVDALEEQGPYPGLASSSMLRIREREAWEAIKRTGAEAKDVLALAALVEQQQDLDESCCHFCGHVTRPWVVSDETWALVEPKLGQQQACLPCFYDALDGLMGEPLRVLLPAEWERAEGLEAENERLRDALSEADKLRGEAVSAIDHHVWNLLADDVREKLTERFRAVVRAALSADDPAGGEA